MEQDNNVPDEGVRSYWIRHFSLSNPRGNRQSDVSRLLRSLADEISRYGEIDILDITYSVDVADGEEWPSFTVYFSKDGDQ